MVLGGAAASRWARTLLDGAAPAADELTFFST